MGHQVEVMFSKWINDNLKKHAEGNRHALCLENAIIITSKLVYYEIMFINGIQKNHNYSVYSNCELWIVLLQGKSAF